MLKEERHQLILDQLSKSKKINLTKLSTLLSVSYDSIRRDIIELEDKGLLKKVHGGAVANSYLNILGSHRKEIKKGAELDIIIGKTLQLIESNQVIIMDGGTTNFFLAEKLAKNISLTVITNSPPLAMVLNEHENIEVILLGGTYFKRYQITLGLEVSQQITKFNADLFIMGVNGVDATNGLTIRNYEEAALKKLMMSVSKKTICAVVEEKLKVSESFQICEIKDLHALITNLNPDHALLLNFKNIRLI